LNFVGKNQANDQVKPENQTKRKIMSNQKQSQLKRPSLAKNHAKPIQATTFFGFQGKPQKFSGLPRSLQ
jgi:hypothetical protein